MNWDPQLYLRYGAERQRPLDELVERIPVPEPALVVDLGCGPGPMSASLAERWPQARITGVDSSPEMIEAAAEYAQPGRVEFVCCDVRDYRPDQPVDVVLSNALLQWVPGHLTLLDRFAGWLRPGGAFAFQVPANFDAPSHVAIRELRQSSRWRDRLGEAADRSGAVAAPATYLAAMVEAGLRPDVWQTTYLHVLSGEDAVLEWVRGTALRSPVLAELARDPDSWEQFLAELGERLREAYPRQEFGTVFPFTRTFAVGRAAA